MIFAVSTAIQGGSVGIIRRETDVAKVVESS